MKTRTPFSSVILYIFGIIFLIVAAFMLVTSITYTKMYLASYETTFSEMWSNSVQYVIEKFLPYFAAGVICFGIGKAISVFRKAQAAQLMAAVDPEEAAAAFAGKGDKVISSGDIAMRLEEMREVGSIKLEELERREKVRLEDLRENVVRDMAINKLQREAKEEEIISKLNAMGEKLGLDMADIYAKSDIPVVPETDSSTETEIEEDKLADDPMLEELEKAKEAPTEEAVEEPAEEEPVAEPEIEEEPIEEEPEVEEGSEAEPEDVAEPEVVEEPAEEEPVIEPEAEEEPEVEVEPEAEEGPETEVEPEEEMVEVPLEEAAIEVQDEEVPEETPAEESEEVLETPIEEVEELGGESSGDEQVLTMNDEPGRPEQVGYEQESDDESKDGEESLAAQFEKSAEHLAQGSKEGDSAVKIAFDRRREKAKKKQRQRNRRKHR